MTGTPPDPIERREIPPADVPPLLRDGRYKDILGCPERNELDFKQGWYRLDEDLEKWELAKDVAAMANTNGGYIVRGVQTIKSSLAEEELASAVKPIPVDKVNIEQHRSVVKEWCYPKVQGIEFNWYPTPEHNEVGILVIVVPSQNEGDKYFLITRVIDVDGKKRPVFGVPIRDGAHTDWLPPGVIWRDLSEGRRRRIAPGPETPVDAVKDRAPLLIHRAQLMDEVESFMGWGDGPTYALTAVPAGGLPRPTDFYEVDGLFGALSNPPTIRWAGFGLSYEETPERIGHDLVVAAARERCLWLRPNGTFIAATNAQGEFLSWSYNVDRDRDGPVPINPVVLIEYTYLFCLFVHEHLVARYGSNWLFGVEIRGARTRNWSLVLPARYPRADTLDAEPTGDYMLEYVEGAQEPDQDAAAMVETVYDFFALPKNSIPFLEDGRIAVNKIVELARS